MKEIHYKALGAYPFVLVEVRGVDDDGYDAVVEYGGGLTANGARMLLEDSAAEVPDGE